jgi:hypothetical protein
MFSLFESHERLLAVRYIAHMVLALYPPFLVLAVVHKFYTEKRELYRCGLLNDDHFPGQQCPGLIEGCKP